MNLHLYIIMCTIKIIFAANIGTLSVAYRFTKEGNKRDPRIVGGNDAEQNEFPYMVSLKYRGGHLCGGSIVHEYWVLTAAHCLCNGFNEQINITLIKGVAGLHKISEYNKKLFQNTEQYEPYEFSFRRAVIHPKYKCTKPINDLALLETEIRLIFNENVKPICFTKHFQSKELYENSLATVIGWGWTNEDRSIGIRSDILQKANVKVWKNEICQESFAKNHKKNMILETHLCAGYKNGGIDSCWADSGGPLIYENSLIGVVSTGIGCARPGLPGIYTRVSKYIDWIEDVCKA